MDDNTPKVPFSFYLPRELRERIRQIAKRKGQSMSALIRASLWKDYGGEDER